MLLGQRQNCISLLDDSMEAKLFFWPTANKVQFRSQSQRWRGLDLFSKWMEDVVHNRGRTKTPRQRGRNCNKIEEKGTAKGKRKGEIVHSFGELGEYVHMKSGESGFPKNQM